MDPTVVVVVKCVCEKYEHACLRRPVSPQAFADNVRSKADVIQATGDAVCVFKELQCLTPRGRYVGIVIVIITFSSHTYS